MTDLEKELIEHLRSLAVAGRGFWDASVYNAEDYFESRLVRAEDFLREVVKNANI